MDIGNRLGNFRVTGKMTNRDVCRMFYGEQGLPIGNWRNEQMTIEGSWKHSKVPRIPDFVVHPRI